MRRLTVGVGAGLLTMSALAVTVCPKDDGRVLYNPGMGWTMHYYSNDPKNYGTRFEPGDTLRWFPGCTTVYLRIPWAYLEPEEGHYNWNALDTPAQRWIEQGGQVAFRITTSEDWLEYATPKWVFDAGAKGIRYKFGWGEGGGPDPNGRAVDPDFVDPVYLAKLEKFLAAFAARYDGRPEVAFVDIGTYGLWGEGHTHGTSRVPQEKMNVDVKRHIDLHLKYFKKTPLVISDDVSFPSNPDANPELLRYAREKGVGWRDDSIMVEPPPMSWKHVEQAQYFWKTLPVVLEHDHFHGSHGRGAWRTELLAKSVEDHHASFMSIHGDPRQILTSNETAIAAVNRRLGYRFLPTEITWPEKVQVGLKGRPFTISWSWKNLGVAPSYRAYYPCLTVKDAKGRLMAVLADSAFDLSGLQVAAPGLAPEKAHEAEFTLGRWFAPETKAGVYDVYVSVGEADGTPVVELPLPDGDGRRRYRIGQIEFTDDVAELQVENLHVRDPYVVVADGCYHLFAAKPWYGGDRVKRYVSRDLKTWTDEGTVMKVDPALDCGAVWAPEMHRYRGKWYLFVTLTLPPEAGTVKPMPTPGCALGALHPRGTWIFSADTLEGPFIPVRDGSVTPAEWMCLDGTFFEENGKPYMVFCHEWCQVGDGRMVLAELKEDLSGIVGEPQVLFRASSAEPECRVTDGPFLYRSPVSQRLFMIWSSRSRRGYTVYLNESETGSVKGPWKNAGVLFGEDGGHGMVFRTLDGGLCYTLHQPDGTPNERLHVFNLIDDGGVPRLGEKGR